ncbi:3-alpha-hydroxysteroid dehydrogenase/carbonyl reductase [Fusarium oxysporum f. sp. albedinis]|nr:3-alpha-hydroxysteroid dehydrogenase/carbonyl reductase [Fusarium oxysporum f. sp. albedinis]
MSYMRADIWSLTCLSGSHDGPDQANIPENKSHCATDRYLRAQTTMIVSQIEAIFVTHAPRYLELAVYNP